MTDFSRQILYTKIPPKSTIYGYFLKFIGFAIKSFMSIGIFRLLSKGLLFDNTYIGGAFMVVKFYHSGVVDKKSSNQKNDRYKRKHRRKLIINEISYLNKYSEVCTTDNGYFWGEWEAESDCQKRDNFYLHSIKYPSEIETNKKIADCNKCRKDEYQVLNTDPYVFGNYFIYSNCMQDRYRNLKALKENDLIIFGSQKSNFFIIDTVFVVDKQIRKEDCSECFIRATGNLIDDTYQIYKGKTFKEDNGLFSFFPCSTQPFERPRIVINGTNDAQKQGVAYIRVNSVEVWNSIKKQVVKSGCMLGIYAKEPKENAK